MVSGFPKTLFLLLLETNDDAGPEEGERSLKSPKCGIFYMLSTNGEEKKKAGRAGGTGNRTGSFGLKLDWQQYAFSHGLKSFSTSALLSLWGMLESGVSCRILGAGQHLHLLSTVSGLEKNTERKPVKRAQNLCCRRGQERGMDPSQRG